MKSSIIIASGKWKVVERIKYLNSEPSYVTFVEDERGRMIGKFCDRISMADARVIANAPDMLRMLKLMEYALSSILCRESPSVSELGSILTRARRIIDNVK